MKQIRYLSCISVLFLCYSSVSYGATLNINNGTLFGAFDVNVNGALYDVEFKDGTCIELYNGCDRRSDFIFSQPEDDGEYGRQASTALLEQVFINSSLGAFDTNPVLTNGCNSSKECWVLTPIFMNTNSLQTIVAVNTSLISNDGSNLNNDHLLGHSRQKLFDSSAVNSLPNTDKRVYAIWSPVSEVPVPTAVWLFSSGLIGLVGMRKKSKLP
jgi:hypothetical protein